MNCRYCNDTGKYRLPNDVKRFERLVELEMDKAYFVNYNMAMEKAYQKVGYTVIDCPYCNISKQETVENESNKT